MKKLILLYSLCLIVFSTYSQKSIFESKWQERPIKVDGNISDWESNPTLYDFDTKLDFEIANDSSNLYICFIAKDVESQARIIKAGMKVTLSKSGKPRTSASIDYPILQDMEDDSPNNQSFERGNRPNLNRLRDEFKLQQTTMKLNGFLNGNGISPLINENGLSISIDWDKGNNLVYEIKVPFSVYFGENYQINDLQDIITLKVKLNAINKPNNMGEPMRSGGGMQPGGGTKPGGGMRPGGMNPGGQGGNVRLEVGPNGNIFNAIKFKLKFSLTFP